MGSPNDPKIALVLSGGGARGAYEVGVLSYVLDHIARVAGNHPDGRRRVKFDFILGTSVGALNACFLAAHAEDPVIAIRRLANLWCEIDMSEVLGFGVKQLTSLPRLFMGGGSQTVGIFDVSPMARLVEREIPWRSITRSLRAGHLSALSVSATEVASGTTVLFMQATPGQKLPETAPHRTTIRATRIGPIHALASAAIPFLFPQVRIGNQLFMDGGVRQNTPIAPALRLGATHVFAIGLSREVRVIPRSEEKPPNAAFIIGKILNAFLLDHVQTDFEILNRVNELVDLGCEAFGDDFVDRLNARALERHAQTLRRVETVIVRPSIDIGALAASYLRSARVRAGPALRRIVALLDVGEETEADLASYLLFDGGFARTLIELGRADAEAQRHEIERFFHAARDAQG